MTEVPRVVAIHVARRALDLPMEGGDRVVAVPEPTPTA